MGSGEIELKKFPPPFVINWDGEGKYCFANGRHRRYIRLTIETWLESAADAGSPEKYAQDYWKGIDNDVRRDYPP
jgi:hypothetical protein